MGQHRLNAKTQRRGDAEKKRKAWPSYLRIVVLLVIFFVPACTFRPAPGIVTPDPETTPVVTQALVGIQEAPTALVPAVEATLVMEGGVQSSNTAAPTAVNTAGPVPATAVQPTPTAAAPTRAAGVTGVELHNMALDEQMALVAQAGTHWVRRNGLSWAAVEAVAGRRDWSAVAGLEAELLDAVESGVEVILVVREAPDWARASGSPPCAAVLPEQYPAFASFLAEAVQRYSLAPYHVKYWEIGNEPDVSPGEVPFDSPFGCLGIAGDRYYGGGEYASLLKAAYPAVKAANPEAQVLTGGLLLSCDPVNPPETQPGSGQRKDCTPARFLEGILANGGGDFFDGVSFHAYDYYYAQLGQYGNPNWNSTWDMTGPALIAKARYLRGLLAGFGYPDKYLINTESGLVCGSDASEDFCQAEDFEHTKAYYLAEANAAALAEGLDGNIWYSLTGWRGTGLIAGGAPKPAYTALQTSAQMLSEATFVAEVTAYPGVKGYAFDTPHGRLLFVWSLDGQMHPITLPGIASAIYDVYGSTLLNAQEVEIGLAPVYIYLP